MKKILLGFLFASFALTCFGQMVKLTPSNPSGERIKFGSAISLAGDYLAVGAPDEDVSGDDNLGTVYVYTRNNGTWTQTAKLSSPSNDTYKQFGNGVATDGNYLAVGSFNDLQGGKVYIYTRSGNNWSKTADIVPSPAAVSFGSAIGFLDDMVLIGARGDRNGEGSVYVYRRSGNNWNRVTRIASPHPTPSGFFGGTIAVYQDWFITGAVGNVQGEGRAYIYKWNGSDFVLESELKGNDIQQSDRFGVGVSMNSDEAVVGSLWDDDNGSESGSAYLFTRNGSTWTQSQKLIASDGDGSDNFGGAVALVNDKLIVTAPTDEDFGSFAGAAYEFTYNGNTWTETNKLGSPDANQNEGFGRLIANSGKTIAIAASGDDEAGAFMGAVFVMELNSSNTLELVKLANSVDIFPNPASEVINVKLSRLEGYSTQNEVSYRIVDTTGKVVQTGVLNETINQLNIAKLPNGNYVLEMDWNGNSFGKQFIK